MKQFFWIVLAWACLLTLGLLANHLLEGDFRTALGTAGRMGSSITLVLLAIAAFIYVSPAARRYTALIGIGMALGTIGDFFNAGLLQFIPLKDATLGAIIAFGLGHLCYMAAILKILRDVPQKRNFKVACCIGVWQLIGLASWWAIVYGAEKNSALVWPALGYTLLLSGTAGLASGLAIHVKRLWPLALGAALFLASDLLLAIGMFRGSFAFRSESVWLTYGPGQMLIVISTLLLSQHVTNPNLACEPPAKNERCDH